MKLYYGVAVLGLFWLVCNTYSIFAKKRKLILQDKRTARKYKMYFTVSAIIGSVLAHRFLITTSVSVNFVVPELLLLFSVFSIMGILNGLIALFQKPLVSMNDRKDYGIGIILLSLGVGTTILYRLVDVLLIRYLSSLIIVVGVIFATRSLTKQIKYRPEE